jgi:hypothetical protein
MRGIPFLPTQYNETTEGFEHCSFEQKWRDNGDMYGIFMEG